MRLKYQSKPYLYEVISTIKFDSIGKVTQRTLYGSDSPLNKQALLKRARQNIENKLENSNGRIISIKITNEYF